MHSTAILKPVECQLACVHYIQIIDVQMEQSVVKGVSFMETFKRANVSAIAHEASTSITTTSFMVHTFVHHMKTPSILLCNELAVGRNCMHGELCIYVWLYHSPGVKIM